MTIDELKAYKRKAKAQRDNWKARALALKRMVNMFRWCIEFGVIPSKNSPCHKKVQELLQ
jgi:hypothetical protein